MRQLLRESSIMSSNCISSLLKIVLFLGNAVIKQGFRFLRGNADWDHVGGSSLCQFKIKLHQTGGVEGCPVCRINSVPCLVGLPLHSLALRAGLNRKYLKMKMPHKNKAYRHGSDHLTCCHLQHHGIILSCVSLDSIQVTCLMLLVRLKLLQHPHC